MNLIAQRFADVYVYSTFFYTKLLSDGHHAVQTWNKGVDIFSKRLLIFPVHLQAHWCLSAVKIAGKQILYFNSLGHANSTCLQTIRDYLEKQSECNNCKLKDVKWQCVHCSDIPMQYNSYDCGVFICTYARCLAANSPFKFNQGDMQNIRRHMVLELLSKALIL